VYNVQINAAMANLLKACEWQRRMLSELNRRTEYMETELNAKDEEILSLTEKLNESNERTERLIQQLTELEANCIKKDEESGRAIAMSDEQKKYFDYICSRLNITYDPALIEKGNFDYFEFENVFRGSEELIKERQRQYIPFLKNENEDGHVLELGFGRGELLALMKENEISAVGVDCYPPFVKYCKDRGYDVAEGDALTYLTECGDESLNGIILSQVAEHVGDDYLYQLIKTGYKKLRSGCPFIIETPNAETLSTFTEFYIDSSHMKPVSFHTLNFAFRESGYSEVIRLENEYSKHPLGEEMQDIIIDKQTDEKAKEFYGKLQAMLFGARDYTIIARK
jgi:SAM-dependent methyltransferase